MSAHFRGLFQVRDGIQVAWSDDDFHRWGTIEITRDPSTGVISIDPFSFRIGDMTTAEFITVVGEASGARFTVEESIPDEPEEQE